MKYKIRFKIGKAKADCEKMVLPGIIFINTNHESFEDDRREGFMIFLGWWHWSISFGLIRI